MSISPLSYKGRLRVRVNGLLVQDKALLLVKMRSPIIGEDIWTPPGGGLEFGESMEECLIREFYEETGLSVSVGSLRHVNELLEPPFHAVEFYFDVFLSKQDVPVLGKDPERSSDRQILKDLQFIFFKDFSQFPIVPEYLKKQFVEDYTGGRRGISYNSAES